MRERLPRESALTLDSGCQDLDNKTTRWTGFSTGKKRQTGDAHRANMLVKYEI